jgi:hypothetical protein
MVSDSATADFGASRYDDERWKVSAWVRQFKPEMLTTELLEQARQSAVPGLMVRARRLLVAFAKDHAPGPPASLTKEEKNRYLATSWCKDLGELDFMLRAVLVEQMGWLASGPEWHVSVGPVALSPKGLLELESAIAADFATGFCAMWFADALLPFYSEVVESAVRACGYDPLRLDHKEHNNRIDDEIIASIRGSRFVIADMTGHRGGVYYEAGFAHGLGLPVIFMLREDDQKDVHFDVRQQNFILWSPDDLPEARKRLENRIRATLGQGPLNPQRP